MQLLRNILALAPCGKPQVSHFVHVTELRRWLPGRVNFTNLEHYGGWSTRTHARWFARPFPFARLAVAALGAVHPRELLIVDVNATFVSKSRHGTWGWFARHGLHHSLWVGGHPTGGGRRAGWPPKKVDLYHAVLHPKA